MFLDEKTQGEAAPVKTGTLKLSEAIRIGAKLRPQGLGHAFKDGKSCAWGAAYEGVGGEYNESLGYSNLVCDYLPSHFMQAFGTGEYSIACMNDNGMTREAIADFLEARGL